MDREIEHVQRLNENLLQDVAILSRAADCVAELDWSVSYRVTMEVIYAVSEADGSGISLFAFATAAETFGYHRPVMTEENVLTIHKGR